MMNIIIRWSRMKPGTTHPEERIQSSVLHVLDYDHDRLAWQRAESKLYQMQSCEDKLHPLSVQSSNERKELERGSAWKARRGVNSFFFTINCFTPVSIIQLMLSVQELGIRSDNTAVLKSFTHRAARTTVGAAYFESTAGGFEPTTFCLLA